MAELLESYSWVTTLSAMVLLLLFVAAQRLLSKYGYFKVRCPNCKRFNAYSVEYKDTGTILTRIAVSRSGVAREVEYKSLKLTYTCSACDHVWEESEAIKA